MTINTSDLDFYDIKSKLKTYFRNSGEFEDYDFDASGLSNILDVLGIQHPYQWSYCQHVYQ